MNYRCPRCKTTAKIKHCKIMKCPWFKCACTRDEKLASFLVFDKKGRSFLL